MFGMLKILLKSNEAKNAAVIKVKIVLAFVDLRHRQRLRCAAISKCYIYTETFKRPFVVEFLCFRIDRCVYIGLRNRLSL